MAGSQEKWYFTKEQLQNSPSRKCGLDADKELAYRQQAANLIQDMGQRLQVSQLCINTAIVYMHRFYAFHSFTQFHRNAIAAAALFLAAKVEEQPRKLEYVIKVAHVCLHRGEGANAFPTSEQYTEQAQDLVFNENVLLQTLGFDVAIDHPHTHVVRTCHLVKAPKDLAQTSYFMASNSLHLTTMCLQYRPTVVACFCIHLASKWSNWAVSVQRWTSYSYWRALCYVHQQLRLASKIPQSNEGRHWFQYVDRSVTSDLLERLTAEFLHIFDKCPSRLKRKMMTMSNSGSSPHAPAAFDKKHAPTTEEFDKSAFDKEYERERRRQPMPGGYVPATGASTSSSSSSNPPPPQKIDYNLYREKKEREERERREERDRRQQAMQQRGAPGQPRPAAQPQPPHHQRPPHHHKPPWPHKPPHKPPHDHRHHRPSAVPPAGGSHGSSKEPSASQPATSAASAPPQPEMRTRPPSLFSPENVTTPTAAAAAPRRPTQPQSQPPRPKPEVDRKPTIPPIEQRSSPKKRPETIRDMPPSILSPFSSPPAKETKPRQRHQSNSSEPELVPVVKKIEETPGYENVIRDSQRGNVIKTRPPEVKIEKKPELPPRSLNGIETDPTLVSNLLKESLAKPVPITVPTEKKSPIEIKKEPVEPPPPPPQPEIPPPAPAEEPHEHKHKKEKKKKEKHKHKDRDKSKEERKKHKKDKEKERKREPSPPPPVQNETNDGTFRITIPRDKLSSSPGLKIKIPKERLAQPPPPPQSLKIKISKEVLETSRKRQAPPGEPAPAKLPRHNGAPKVRWPPNPPNPPQYSQPLPYYMVQPPPPLYYGMGMDGYFYGMVNNHMGNMGMYPPQPPQPPQQKPPQPPLPPLPPPPVPPPPPE